MKEEQRHLVHLVVQVCRFNIKWLILLLLCLISCALQVKAQCSLPSDPFYEKEEINFDLYFKWGLLMPKAAAVKAVVQKSTYDNEPAWRYRMLLNSIGLVDKAFRVRDTIDSYFSTDYKPRMLFGAKNSREGGYYQMDKLTFTTIDGKDAVQSFRRSVNSIKIDSLMYGDGCIYDILGALTYIRTIDWTDMAVGAEGTFNCVMGRDMIKVVYRYAGQKIIEKGDAKYKTRHFIFDIYDESFSQSREAAEVWVGDDKNHIPIKVRAKLKIGAAEAYYNSSLNLRFPFDCRFVLPKRYAEREEMDAFNNLFVQE